MLFLLLFSEIKLYQNCVNNMKVFNGIPVTYNVLKAVCLEQERFKDKPMINKKVSQK